MTGTDWLWLVATVLFVGGAGVVSWVMWATRRPSQADRYGAFAEQPASWRVIPGPPYDWSKDPEG